MLPNLSALRLQQQRQPLQSDLEQSSDSDPDSEPGFGEAHMDTGAKKSLSKLENDLGKAKAKLYEAMKDEEQKKKAKAEADKAKGQDPTNHDKIKAAKAAEGKLKSAQKAVEKQEEKVAKVQAEIEAKKAEAGPGGTSKKGIGINKNAPAGTVVVPAEPDPVDEAKKKAMTRDDYNFFENDPRRCVTRDVYGNAVRYVDGVAERAYTDGETRVSGIDIIKIFDNEELEALRLELRQAVDHMPELKPASGVENYWSHDAERARRDALRYEYTHVVQDSSFEDPKQLLVGGGFAALGNPGSFHNQFVRRLRRKVQEKVLERNLFGLDPDRSGGNSDQVAGPCVNANRAGADRSGKMIEQVIDRMLVRKPGQSPPSETWHRDVAKGVFTDDEVFGGWLNLDPPLSSLYTAEDFQYFSCIPFTADDPDAKTQTGFAKVAKEVLAKKVEQACKIRVPPGYLLVFNELTVHEVLPTPSERIMSRVFFGWRLTDQKHHLWTPEDPNANIHRTTMPLPTKDKLLNNATTFEDLRNILKEDNVKPTHNRFPCIPGLKKRLEEQEGIPLKSGQHPESWQQNPANVDSPNHGTHMFRPESLDNRFKDLQKGTWTVEGQFYDRTYIAIPTEDDLPGVLPKAARFEDYPQGPPNWPRTWVVEQDVRDFLLKFNAGVVSDAKVHDDAGNVEKQGQAVLDMKIKNKKPCRQAWDADAYLTHEGAKVYNRGIWAGWLPKLTFRWKSSADKHKVWRDSVRTAANTFDGLMHYKREGLLRSETRSGRDDVYPEYTEDEMAIHFPLTYMEARYYLGMLGSTEAENRQRQYHKEKPFYIEPRAYYESFEGDTQPPSGQKLKPPPCMPHLQQRGRPRLGSKRCYDEVREHSLCVDDHFEDEDVYMADDGGSSNTLAMGPTICDNDPS